MNGIDCATKLNAISAANLKAAGIDAVGRYLGQHSWKGMTPDEVKAIQAAGLAMFLIFETNPTNAGYFNYAKGQNDAHSVLIELQALAAPQGITVYFAVDYDAQPADMAAICEYFRGIHAGLEKYLVGAYGSFDVLTALEKTGNVDRYYQTYAWSHDKVFHANHIYQHQNGVTIAGVQVDKDQVNNTDGLWGKAVAPAPQPQPQSQPVQQNFSYPNNARVMGDDLYIRDANGNQIPGRYVSNGDHITVLDVSYSRQLALVEYSTPSGVRNGYVRNVLIKYANQGLWHNGSTPEPVLDENGAKIGYLNPHEAATPLYRKGDKLHVVYNTNKGTNTKSGYVSYNGGFTKF